MTFVWLLYHHREAAARKSDSVERPHPGLDTTCRSTSRALDRVARHNDPWNCDSPLSREKYDPGPLAERIRRDKRELSDRSSDDSSSDRDSCGTGSTN